MNFKRLVRRVPDTFQEVEYIQTDGNAYINTGYAPKLYDKYSIVFSEASGTQNAVVFGSRTSGSFNTSHDQVYLNLTSAIDPKIAFFEGIANNTIQDRVVNTAIALSLNLTDSVNFDDTATQPLYLFLLNNRGSAAAQSTQSLIKIYSLEMSNGNTQIRNFIPCYRISDNVIGMYDTVNDVFYTNSGTGSFSKGNDVNTWHDIPYYQHKTATDTLTLPAVIYPNDTSITVGIKGNTTQSGTPSPSNPVSVDGVGELETSGEHAGQYKIPISSTNTTTNVYLGEVETMRKIKKLVLTGEETSWNEPAVGIHRLTLDGYMRENSNIPLCTHYIGVAPVSAAGDVGNLRIAFLISASGNNYMYIRDSSYSTVSAFKSYLAAQYAAGTPVTVWYVLATEETAVVNEPLRKISTYADEVSGITVPVTAGADTLSIGTTLQPSEVTVNYKGWHPVANVHERENGAWT